MKMDSYQIEAVAKALQRRRFGVFFQQRVGKSRVAIQFIRSLFKSEGIGQALIVCPLISRYVWKQEIETHTNMSVVIVNNRADLELKDNTIYILNYDKLTKLDQYVYKCRFRIVIADEVHMIKNRTSKRSKRMGTLGNHAQYTLGLTGTPYSNESGSKEHTSFQDLFGMYRFIDPNLFGTNWAMFKNRYCVMGGYMNYQIVKYTLVDEILEKVNSSSMRVLRKDVMTEPTTTDITIPVTLPKKAMDMYKELEKEALLELGSLGDVTADLVITKRLRLHQFCGGFAKPDDHVICSVHTAKIDALLEMLSDIDDKVIVSFKYLSELLAVSHLIPSALVINGSVAEKRRKDIIQVFRDTDLKVLLVQEQTVSVSLELSFCNKIIFYSVGDDLITHSQIRDRLMGRFQKADEVMYYYLLCEKTIDNKIYKALKNNTRKSELYANWETWIRVAT